MKNGTCPCDDVSFKVSGVSFAEKFRRPKDFHDGDDEYDAGAFHGGQDLVCKERYREDGGLRKNDTAENDRPGHVERFGRFHLPCIHRVDRSAKDFREVGTGVKCKSHSRDKIGRNVLIRQVNSPFLVNSQK